MINMAVVLVELECLGGGFMWPQVLWPSQKQITEGFVDGVTCGGYETEASEWKLRLIDQTFYVGEVYS